MSERPSPESVALAKARPNYVQNVSEWGEWARAMRPYYDQAEETTACAAIRILAAECDALAKEMDGLLEALEALTSQMQVAHNDHDITVRVFQIPTGEVRKARAAIAAAKGSQQ